MEIKMKLWETRIIDSNSIIEISTSLHQPEQPSEANTIMGRVVISVDVDYGSKIMFILVN